MTAGRLRIGSDGWLAYYRDDELTSRVVRFTQHGNVYIGATTAGADVQDRGTNALITISEDATTQIPDTSKIFNTPFKIGGSNNTIGVYASISEVRTGWFAGITDRVQVSSGTFADIYLIYAKGLLVGVEAKKD